MSEIVDSKEFINEKLIADFGLEGLASDKPRFRLVWSDDEFEKRWTKFTAEGFELVHPEVKLLPKYRQYIQGRYILERLVPVVGETDLVEKVSYEPLWVFQTGFKTGHQYLPPRYDLCHFLIENLLNISGRTGMHAKYKDPAIDPEYRTKLVDDMRKTLFGNETAVGDALAHDYGVTVPRNFEKNSTKVENGESNV
jgi:hypothetical protein